MSLSRLTSALAATTLSSSRQAWRAGIPSVTAASASALLTSPPRRHRHDIQKVKNVKKVDLNLRWSYTRGGKSPYQHGTTDCTNYTVEGVSDKQYPIMLKWRRPDHVQRSYKGDHGSGDLSGLPEIDEDEPVPRLAPAKGELERAPEHVRRANSMAFGRNADRMARIQEGVRRSVARHALDHDSLEVKIARKTMLIRDMQRRLDELEDYEVNRCLKHILKISVDMRRGYLNRLRRMDYKKFEWLLEKLDLVYRPRPYFYEKVQRKRSMSRLTDLWCDELKQHRLKELRDRLKGEQPGYLRGKAESLRWMRQEQEELGMEVTVTEEEIDECEARAAAVEEEIARQNEKEKDNYYVYVPEVVDNSQKY